ncbi:MAG: acetylglutamate kinase [Candidatus Cryptobacteroides sp.]
MKLNVLKIGGAVVEDEAALSVFLKAFTAMEGSRLLVHGGGRTASNVCEKLGIKPMMAGGRRITDGDTLKVVTAVYAGLVNKNIVAKLQAGGVNAFGLCGADFNVITSVRRPVTAEGLDFGYVGDPVKVDNAILTRLITDGVIPVVSPITHDGNGQLLNTNADTIASAVAGALSSDFEVSLTYCFEKEGVLDTDGRLIEVIDQAGYETLKAEGVVSGGMLPKIDNAFSALRKGIRVVRITSAASPEGGTLIRL